VDVTGSCTHVSHMTGQTVGPSHGAAIVSGATITAGDTRLAERLRHEIRGDVLFDRADRGRYATDASIYQVEPIGVIVPEEIGDVAAALAIARE
jgi:FAD/FMN-containing dehydrogenase